MRLSTACMACRSRRRKCHTLQTGSACSYCIERGFQCSRDIQSISGSLRSPATEASTQPIITNAELAPKLEDVIQFSNELPPKTVCLELVQLYFDYIHDQFHSLFHPPTVLMDVESGKAAPVIVLAMMALSARFSSNPEFEGIDPRKRGDVYARKSNLLLDLRDISLKTIQVCVLLGAFSITCGESAAESVYYCAACRIANLLNLAYRSTADGLQMEINRRVWWSLCMTDVWSSTGVNLPRQMPELEGLPLPMDDVVFLGLKAGDFLHDHKSPASAPLLSQMITLNRILLKINELNTQTAIFSLSPGELESQVSTLSNALESWHDSLPILMHDSPSNLSHWASQGLGRMFVAVYLGYYHFGQLLFYQFLQGDSQTNVPHAQSHAQKCKNYAQSLCEIVYASHNTPNCDVQYTMVGHILVIASTVQTHILLFSDNENQISAARSRLEKNFEILSSLRTYWPTLDASFSRLRAFHQACRDSMDESFRLDLWMLRFLSEFAEPVDDKVVGGSPDQMVWSWENIGGSPSIM